MKKINKSNIKFIDKNFRLSHFADYFLVVCPECGKMAQIMPKVNFGKDVFTTKRVLTCDNCGFLKTKESWQELTLYLDRDWFFEEPLWLRMNCCSNILSAYNMEHLQYLEEYVEAKLRSRKKDEETGWQNQSLTSRLPSWIKEKKNRDEILKAINKLKNKIR